jgi:Tfp pilus assembly protein PilF
LASRPLPDTVSRIGASLCLPCLLCFLWLAQRAAARTQDSPVKAQQSPSSTTPVSAVQANASSASAKDAAEPGEPLAPDPALAPARLLLQQGKLSEAEAATRNFLLAHADSAEAHFLLGFILFREIGEKWREAGKAQEATLPYSDGSGIGSLAEFRDAKARESLAEFTAGARYHAASAFDLKIVALDYLLLKHNMDADRWLTQSVQLNSRDAQAWYYLGRTKYSTGQFREAIEAFEQCLKLEPRNVEAENNVGLSYEALQRPDEAIQAFENAIAWQTESSAKDPEPFIELAHLYLNENQPEKAVPYLSQSIAISPNVSKAHEELGKAYSLLHRLSEAQAELEKAIELTPQAPNVHCLLAPVYSKQGLEEKAKAESDRCAALSGTHSTS